MQPSSLVTPRHKLAMALAAVHLLLVVCSVTKLRTRHADNPWGRVLQAYAAWTGAGSRFNFFAPGINSSVRVAFDVKQDSGALIRDDFQSDDDAMSLRAYCMVLRFGMRTSQDELARAWAATMFGRHPEAHTVTVSLEQLRLPTMEQYQEGQRPAWTELYRADFEHRLPSRAVHALESP